MQQSFDFKEECDVLAQCVADCGQRDWNRQTQFKNWSLDDIFVHLHFWNEMAHWSLMDEPRFRNRLEKVSAGLQSGGLRPIENELVEPRGQNLFEIWREFSTEMADKWSKLDPKQRVAWAGPDMSVRSSMTARQMETWAHGQSVFDLFGVKRRETDRIKNVVVLGVNTFGWSHKVQGMSVPDAMPKIELTAPSGDIWTFGEEAAGHISGTAVEFAQVVTQTRNVLDTDLVVRGDVAKGWMSNAQCFAGPTEKPPQKGQRFASGED